MSKNNRSRNFGKDWNNYVRIYTPEISPLPFGGFFRLAAKVECVKCEQQGIQVIRVHRIHLPSFLTETVINKPIPSDEKIMTSFMLRACENWVGCWRNCRPWTHMKVCAHIGECRCPRSKECSCPKGCGNLGIHPCRCGRMFGKIVAGVGKVPGKHKASCPLGLVKRTSSFEVQFMRSQLIRSGAIKPGNA